MKVYRLSLDKDLYRWNDVALAWGSGPVIPSVQALALEQSINLHIALSLGYYIIALLCRYHEIDSYHWYRDAVSSYKKSWYIVALILSPRI